MLLPSSAASSAAGRSVLVRGCWPAGWVSASWASASWLWTSSRHRWKSVELWLHMEHRRLQVMAVICRKIRSWRQKRSVVRWATALKGFILCSRDPCWFVSRSIRLYDGPSSLSAESRALYPLKNPAPILQTRTSPVSSWDHGSPAPTETTFSPSISSSPCGLLSRSFKLWSPHRWLAACIRGGGCSRCPLALGRSRALAPRASSSTSLCRCVFQEKHEGRILLCCPTSRAWSRPAVTTKFWDASTGRVLLLMPLT